jgi:hypothetical protein
MPDLLRLGSLAPTEGLGPACFRPDAEVDVARTEVLGSKRS